MTCTRIFLGILSVAAQATPALAAGADLDALMAVMEKTNSSRHLFFTLFPFSKM